jgi:hypothetical protein
VACAEIRDKELIKVRTTKCTISCLAKNSAFIIHIGAACAKQFRTYADLAEKLKDVTDLMRQCNGKVSPSRALVKGLVKELDY